MIIHYGSFGKMMCLKDNLNCMDSVVLQGIWDERCNTMTTNKSWLIPPLSPLLTHQVTQTPRLMDFTGRFLSHQNTDSPDSFHCSSYVLWFSCQRTPTLRSLRNLFPAPTTETCITTKHLRGFTAVVRLLLDWKSKLQSKWCIGV
jgi:hypothetical protein